MRFVRGQDPKEAMGIGISDELVRIEKLVIEYDRGYGNGTTKTMLNRSDYKEFLEMWQENDFPSHKLSRMLGRSRIDRVRRRKSKIELKGIIIRIPVDDMTLAGNYIGYKLGNKDHAYITHMLKIYSLPIESSHKMLII